MFILLISSSVITVYIGYRVYRIFFPKVLLRHPKLTLIYGSDFGISDGFDHRLQTFVKSSTKPKVNPVKKLRVETFVGKISKENFIPSTIFEHLSSNNASMFDLTKQIDFDNHVFCGIVIVLNVEKCRNVTENLAPLADGFVNQVENGVYLEVFINQKNSESIPQLSAKLEPFLVKKVDSGVGHISCVLFINSTIRIDADLNQVSRTITDIHTGLRLDLTRPLSANIVPLRRLPKMPKENVEWDLILSLIFLLCSKIQKKVDKPDFFENSKQKWTLEAVEAFVKLQNTAELLGKWQKSFDPFRNHDWLQLFDFCSQIYQLSKIILRTCLERLMELPDPHKFGLDSTFYRQQLSVLDAWNPVVHDGIVMTLLPADMTKDDLIKKYDKSCGCLVSNKENRDLFKILSEKNFDWILDDKMDEPYLILPSTDKITFFCLTTILQNGTFGGENSAVAGSKVEALCQFCSPNITRQWICQVCGTFLHHVEGDTLTLMCQCGIGENVELKCVKQQNADELAREEVAEIVLRINNEILKESIPEQLSTISDQLQKMLKNETHSVELKEKLVNIVETIGKVCPVDQGRSNRFSREDLQNLTKMLSAIEKATSGDTIHVIKTFNDSVTQIVSNQ